MTDLNYHKQKVDYYSKLSDKELIKKADYILKNSGLIQSQQSIGTPVYDEKLIYIIVPLLNMKFFFVVLHMMNIKE